MTSKQRGFAALLILLMAGMIVRLLPLMAQGSANTIDVSFSANPQPIVYNETEFTVSIALGGTIDNCPAPPTVRPVDAVLLIDTSNSMMDQDGLPDSRLAYAKQAAELFVQAMTLETRLEDGGDQVGVVLFSDSATELLPLTQDESALIAAIRGIDFDSGTNIAAGLHSATDTVIDAATQNTNAARVIVLLSDGDPESVSDEDAAIAAANRARSAAVEVITIAVGATADTTTMRRIADSSANFYDAPTGGELPGIFQRIADEIQVSIAARQLLFTYSFDNNLFEVIPDGINPPPVSVTPNTITWSYQELDTSDQATFSVVMRARYAFANANIGVVNGSYLLCNTDLSETFSGSGPIVTAVEPSATPTATATPTPLPTNTPPPSPTPTQPSIAVGSFFPVPAQTPPLGTSFSFCETDLGGLIPWILLILILLLLFLPWVLWHWRRHRAGKCSALCFVLWTIFGLWTAITLWLFLLPLLGSLCTPQESVYFWRQDTTTGYTGVYLSADTVTDPVAFNAVNGTGCVGCHIVSNSSGRIAAISGSPPGQLIVYNLDGTPVTIPSIQANFAAFSPDGLRLVYSNAALDLHILDLQTGADVALLGASEPGVVETMPSWGPNGMIAFVRPVNSADAVTGYAINGATDIYVVSENGGTAVALQGASGDGFNYYPSYSPDGRWLAFTHHTNRTTYSDPQAQIYLVPAAGGTRLELAANRDSNSQPTTANSWSTWSRDGSQLAFNSQRSDPNFDIYVTTINPDGSSTAAQPLSGAAQSGVFEHLPFWGMPPLVADPLAQMAGLWPFLLPIPLLALLAWANCQNRKIEVTPEPVKPVFLPPPPPPDPLKEPPMIPPWQPQPSLIIGLGESGRWVLTHLKKTLTDAGLGKVPMGVQLLALDVGNWQQLQNQAAPMQFAGIHLDPSEVVELSDNQAEELKRLRGTGTHNADLQYRTWLDQKALLALGESRVDLRYGANGQRTLARFALLRHLKTADPGLNFFDRLKQAASAVLAAQKELTASRKISDDERLNVIVIGDTFGDLSSAGLFDAALLAREAGRLSKAKGFRFTAHIMTDQVRGGGQNPEIYRVNTGATLREIARFQLAEARPFPIHYDNIEAARCDYLPYDEFVIYDGTGQDTQSPETTVYPAIADTIALWLDTVTGQDSGVRKLRDDENTKIVKAQRENDIVHVISQGIFTYRLPFADLKDVIQSRFQQEIFRALVMGRSLDDPNLRIDERLNSEVFIEGENTAANLANAFLTGRLSASRDGQVPYAMLTLNYLINRGDRGDVTIRTLGKLETGVETAFARALPPLMSLLLNGQAITAQNDIFSARGGKIGFVLAFLVHLQELCRTAQSSLSQVDREPSKRDQLNAGLEKLKTAAATGEASLKEQAQALGLIDGLDDTLRQRVMPRITQLDKRRDEMNRISAVREYLWDDENGQPLDSVWYQKYLVPPQSKRSRSNTSENTQSSDKRQAALNQFFWVVEAVNDAAIRTQLTLVGENARTYLGSGPSEISEFDAAFSDLASRYCAPIIAGQTLAQMLSQTLLNQDQLPKTVEKLLNTSQVQLAERDARESDELESVVIAANQSVDLAELQVRVSYESGEGEGKGYLRLNITDPYSVNLNRRLASVALDSVSSLKGAREQYRRNHNLSNEPNVAKNATPTLTAAYEPEAEALTLEANFRRWLRENPRLLHPVVVTSLTNVQRVVPFYLALAAGDLDTRPVKGKNTRVLYYVGRGQNRAFPTSNEDEHPLISGLMAFLLDETAFPTHELEGLMGYYSADPDAEASYEAWVKGGWRAWVEDLNDSDERTKAIVMDILRVSRLYAEMYRQTT